VHRAITVFVVLSFACGSPRPSTPPPSPPGEAMRPRPPLVEIHEWGLVDVDLASGTAELSAGPGQPARPMVLRKPVLYLHLTSAEQASVLVRARVPGGAILEHWPPGVVDGGTVSWNANVRSGPCSTNAPSRSPVRRETTCAARDGFCEVDELPRYVTSDHDCMDVGGTTASLLFYRASLRADALPLRVERTPSLELAVTAETDTADAPRTMLRISTALSGPWPVGRYVVSHARMPARGQAVRMPVGDEVLEPNAERDATFLALRELGLTEPEARVFVAAWSDELFGTSPSELRQDVLLYWLGPEDVSRLALLETEPAARFRRAFLVRIVLPAVTTA
jgi:hypothetical protein